jgi:hypothetical protein
MWVRVPKNNNKKREAMDYTKYFCPVCNEKFDESSDVVVCPDCGTPHHRECWFKNNKCFNADQHSENKNLGSDYAVEESSVPVEEEMFPVTEADEATQSTENNEPTQETVTINGIPVTATPAETLLIEGKSALLYDIAVRKNQKYYMPRFLAMGQLGKKARLWNFWACIVPLAWSFYRKMYKLSALILALYVMIFAVNGYFIYTNEPLMKANAECAAEDPFYYQNILNYEAGQQVVLTAKQQNLLEQIKNIQIPSYISIGISVLLIACRVLLGIKADYLYMKKIGKTIEAGEALGLKDDALKMFVYRKRGVIPLVIPVLIGLFEWFMIY